MPKFRLNFLATAALLAVVALSPWAAADAQATTRPLLDEMNTETQSLFQQVSGSIVRVQLPTVATIEIQKPNGPATNPSTANGTIVFRMDRGSPTAMGVIVDDQRDVVIPQFIDPADAKGSFVVTLGDGRAVSATFIASDFPSDLTVLRIADDAKGKAAPPEQTKPSSQTQALSAALPADLPQGRPADGTLLLVVSLNPAMNRLTVWQPGWRQESAVLVTTDGRVAGFMESGRFYSAASCEPVAQDLIAHGEVHRPILGVWIETVQADDPQRATDASLGTTPALRVRDVVENTPAQAAGIKQGDLILSIAGKTVMDAHSFAAEIASRRGATALVILRDGKRIDMTVELTAP